jgi:hypothetical protein
MGEIIRTKLQVGSTRVSKGDRQFLVRQSGKAVLVERLAQSPAKLETIKAPDHVPAHFVVHAYDRQAAKRPAKVCKLRKADLPTDSGRDQSANDYIYAQRAVTATDADPGHSIAVPAP